MTYTYKLARRLAISRDSVMLAVLTLLAACAAEPATAPDGPDFRQTATGLARIAVSPDPATLNAGTRVTFTAKAYRRNGKTVAVKVAWTATGGSIDARGVYTAGQAGGKYRVVATDTTGHLADTAAVTVNPAATPVVAVRLMIGPSAVSLRGAATQQFTATAKMSDSSVTSPAVTWTASGGSITGTGLYSAGNTPGIFSVHAVSGNLSAAASVSITTSSGTGIPWGSYECVASTLGPFSLCMRSAGYWSATDMAELQAVKGKLILNQGGYGKFKDASGKYSPTLYYDWVQTLKPNVASWQPYLADGTLVGVQMLDDLGPTNWGGVAITRAQVEQMGKWWKALMPGLTTLVRWKATDAAGYAYTALDGVISQYNARYMGDITTWRQTELAAAASANLSLQFSLNLLDGGKLVDGCYHGGSADYCSMTATEIRTYGAAIAAASGICGLMSWKTDARYQGQPGITDALKYVAGLATTKSAVSCKAQ